MLETAGAGVKSRTANGSEVAMRKGLLVGACLLAGAMPARAQERGLPQCDPPPGEGMAAVVGRVVDSRTGVPLQSADVRVEWEGRGGRTSRVEAETDERGRFQACSVPGGTPLTVIAAFGRANERLTLTVEAGDTRRIGIQVDAPRSRATGRVVEDGTNRGIGDAEIHVARTPIRVTSAGDGSFRLPDLPAGRYLLETSHLGFGTRSDTVEVEYGSIMLYTIGLAPEAIVLQPIDVAVRSVMLEQRGFYVRRERGMGAYLTRQDWSGRVMHLPSELLRTVPGVRIVPQRGGFGNIVLDRGNCAFRYYVDGLPMGPTFQMDELTAEWIEAMEVYRGVAQIPIEFRAPPTAARANCGAIVIWLRGGR
jgi:hypothetical protein